VTDESRHAKTRRDLIGTDFSAEKTGISPPISLEDFVRLPHVLTGLIPDGACAGLWTIRWVSSC
jgi:hypothetical protein